MPRTGALAMLVDAHVHLSELQGVSLEEEWSMLRHDLDEAGVAHAVVITADHPGTGPRRPERIIKLLRGQQRTTIVEGIQLGGKDATDLDAAEKRLREGETHGLKFYPGYERFAIDDRRLQPYFELAAHCGAPVLFHTGDPADPDGRVRDAHPLLLDAVAPSFRDTTFVMCHAGNPWLIDAAEILHKNDNVVADLSGFVAGTFSDRLLAMMQRRVNDMIAFVEDCRGRLMFGSDWPLAKPGHYVRLLDGLDVDEREMESIRWGTAQRVYGFELAKDASVASHAETVR